jgi:hypothetical protein
VSERFGLPGPALAPSPLPTLAKRHHVRVPVPATVTLFARVRAPGSAGPGARCLVTDISAGGLSAALMEGARVDVPHEGQPAVASLEYEGEEAQVAARVVRAGAQQVSLALDAPADQLDLPLLSLIARLVARRIDFVDRARVGAAAARKLTHRHFYGAGYLDVRVETQAPAWWQIVFLEYLISWHERDATVTTGVLDRAFSAERARDPLAVRAEVARHATPAPKLLALAAAIARHCAAAQPAQADAFELMARVLPPR